MSLEPRRQRKRDEKAKLDTATFSNDLISGINSQGSLEDMATFLEAQGDAMDYRTYSETFFDIFVAGGKLAPGGRLANDKAEVAKYSVFSTDGSDEQVMEVSKVLMRLIKRYRYLESLLEDEMAKLIKFIKSFEAEDMKKFAKFTAFVMEGGVCNVKVMENLFTDSLTESTVAEDFIVTFFLAWVNIKEGASSSLANSFKIAGLDGRLEDLFPVSKRSFEYMLERFKSYDGLQDIVAWQLNLSSQSVKQQLVFDLVESIQNQSSSDELISKVRNVAAPAKMKHSDVIPLIFQALVKSTDWNKKIDVMTEQAIRLFSENDKLLLTFTGTKKSQVYLMNNLQTYCYESNQTLMKVYPKLILLMYKLRILGEEAIVQWFHGKHSSKGKSVILESMQPMMNWLNTAPMEE